MTKKYCRIPVLWQQISTSKQQESHDSLPHSVAAQYHLLLQKKLYETTSHEDPSVID